MLEPHEIDKMLAEHIDKYARYQYYEEDIKGQYVILVDGKRITMRNGKSVWSKSWAETMAKRIVSDLNSYNEWSNLNYKKIAKRIGAEPNDQFRRKVNTIKKKWYDEHVRIVPLELYMKMCVNRAK